MTDMVASPARFKASPPLTGRVRVPGDKSISHRALMFSALADGRSEIAGLLEGEDVLATAAALRAMGAGIARLDDGRWQVDGVGLDGLRAPAAPLEMGNSGTSTRLLMGLVAGRPIAATFTGDASLSRRPMGRVIEPLAMMGARVEATGGRLPLTLSGAERATAIRYRLPVASAQVKSAVLLAGLSARGTTEVVEPQPTRDHSERILRGFGADIRVQERDGARHIAVTGGARLRPQPRIEVPGDPSSAAFLVVAGLLVPGSDMVVENVGLNPTRAGLMALLRAMGGRIEEMDRREVGGEPVADLRVRHSPLSGIEVPPEIVPSMIDEFPIFFVAAALARGRTVAHGLEELRVKESDRLALMARGLAALGVAVTERPDGIVIDGRDGAPFAPPTPPAIAAELDHRIAMAFAVAGLASRDGVMIDDMAPVATSFPTFTDTLRALGADA